MRKTFTSPMSLLVALLLLASLPVAATSQTPEASPVADSDGPIAIVGQAGSASGLLSEGLFPDPSVVLIDSSGFVTGDYTFVPDQGQILGYFTEPLFPLPGTLRIDLPVQPMASTIDLDHDDENDTGVQLFSLIVSSNLTGNSYLQQIEQFGGLSSYLSDSQTGAVTQGDFLVYAADGEQAFPSGYGDDGLWFTADDPTITLDAGYTVARLGADGTTTFDRSTEATINTIEAEEAATPDFSDQGILESYNSLIDLLALRYSFTEFAGFDWDAIRATYLPAVEEADAANDMAAYFHTLNQLALSLEDPHVAVSTYNLDILLSPDPNVTFTQGNLGASTIAVTDPAQPDQAPSDTIVVLTVGADSPAAEAGWVPGTEIISVDGKSPAERLDEIPLAFTSAGTEETQRAQKSAHFLSFEPGQQVVVEYRLPDSDEVQSATMESGAYDDGQVFNETLDTLPISLTSDGQYTVLRWSDFISSVDTKIAVLEEALAAATNSGSLILDLRGNSGGWEELYDVMASYFFTADAPMSLPIFDFYQFDASAQDLVPVFSPEMSLSSPKPALAFAGTVIILVDNHCVSACEYFTQAMQVLNRATVIGQYGTLGGGGNIALVQLPGEITMQYTAGRSTYHDTDEFNLQGKGVTLDIRVPVTLETEQAKQQGADPVMDAAKAELDRLIQEEVDAEVAAINATATAEAQQASPEALVPGATPSPAG